MTSGTFDISFVRLLCYLSLFAIPVFLFIRLRLGLTRNLIISIVRMAVQLWLVSFYLDWLFKWNNPLVNVLWMLVMLTVANITIVRNAGLAFKRFALPLTPALLISLFVVFGTFFVVIQADVLLEARYMIPLSGMLLGNLLRGNIVAINRFYSDLGKRLHEYDYWISLGATRHEALRPFLRQAIKAAMAPQIGTMATVGIVSLPGMMTGQILGGASPLVAVKYQIMIMTAIYVSAALSVYLGLHFTIRAAFDHFDRVNESVLPGD